MFSAEKFKHTIFSDDFIFDDAALELFLFQSKRVEVYKQFIEFLKIDTTKINSLEKIPFLPIEFFKTKTIVAATEFPTSGNQTQITFTSSGTTGAQTSSHHVADVSLYEKSFSNCFEKFYGHINEYCLLALLPSYLERSGSSLVYMAEHLIKKSNHPLSGFYLDDFKKLNQTLTQLHQQNQKTILLGVTYSLLDFARYFNSNEFQFPDWKQGKLIILETGGMKGRRKEMVRQEVHQLLSNAFHVEKIHSEYGMTELLSQAYSKGDGIFRPPNSIKILIREMNDPTNFIGNERTGGINVIDLANMYSCAFIATQDLGRTFSDNSFEVLGRFDNSDLRGCNLLL